VFDQRVGQTQQDDTHVSTDRWNRWVYFLVCLSICLFVYLSVCLSVCLSICLFVYLSVCLSVCLSICLFVSLSLLFCLSYYHLSVSVCIIVCLSVVLSVCPRSFWLCLVITWPNLFYIFYRSLSQKELYRLSEAGRYRRVPGHWPVNQKGSTRGRGHGPGEDKAKASFAKIQNCYQNR